MAIVSIQVAATRINGAGAEVVPLASDHRTNFSVYLRNNDGTVDWDRDYLPGQYSAAIMRAADLSMKHAVHIEQIK